MSVAQLSLTLKPPQTLYHSAWLRNLWLKLSYSVPDCPTHGRTAKSKTAISLLCFIIFCLLGCLVWLRRGYTWASSFLSSPRKAPGCPATDLIQRFHRPPSNRQRAT